MNNKIFVLTLGLCIILLTESVWAVNYLKNQKQVKPKPIPTVQEKIMPAKLSLTSPTETVVSGLQFPVILMATPLSNQSIQALDAIILFDPQVLQVAGIDPLLDSALAEYPLLDFDNDKGIIRISLILPEQTIDQETNIAQINFLPIIPGQTDIVFDFEKDKTTDSNVVLQNQAVDSLGEIQNLTISITNE